MVIDAQIKLKHLFTPLNHEKIVLKNRIMQMAMLTRFCDEEGYMTDRYIDFMAARAKGGRPSCRQRLLTSPKRPNSGRTN